MTKLANALATYVYQGKGLDAAIDAFDSAAFSDTATAFADMKRGIVTALEDLGTKLEDAIGEHNSIKFGQTQPYAFRSQEESVAIALGEVKDNWELVNQPACVKRFSVIAGAVKQSAGIKLAKYPARQAEYDAMCEKIDDAVTNVKTKATALRVQHEREATSLTSSAAVAP